MNMNPQVVSLRRGADPNARVPCQSANYLVFKEGRVFVHAVTIDKLVKVVAIPKEETRFARPLELKGKAYPVARAARKFLKAGKSLGITKSARAVLNEIKEVV